MPAKFLKMRHNERGICPTRFKYILKELYLKQHGIGMDRMEQRMQKQIYEYTGVE